MKKGIKRIIAVVLSASMLLSLTACFDKSKEEVLDVADDVASAFADKDADAIADLTAEAEDEDITVLQEILDFEGFYDEETAAVLKAIGDSITYEIDEESAEATKKSEEGSVDVVFTMVDYESVLENEDNLVDVDTCVAAIEDCEDTIDVEVTFDFVLDGEDWLLSDFTEVSGNLYEFVTIEVSFTPALVEMVDSLVWWAAYADGSYTNADTIELDILPTEEGSSYDITWEFYYEVYFSNILVYTSETCTDSGSYIEAYYGTSYSGASVSDDGYLSAGSYTITFYTLDGTQLATSSVNVYEVTDFYEITDGTFASTIGIYGWYQAGYGIATDDMLIYSTSDTQIEFDLEVVGSSVTDTLYYEYFYVTDLDSTPVSVYEGSCIPAEYTNGYFYELIYSGTLEAGYYLVIFGDANQVQYGQAVCMVQ
ncbi:MAG TPA: hypothetical protein PL103_06150 [Saccharofermentans sp.]|nr:hypothetical protein [Saccharofermentans sp.]